MSIVGLVVRSGLPKAVSFGQQVLKWCETHQHEILLEEETAYLLSAAKPGLSAPQLALKANVIVVLGGDGTLIGVARYVTDPAPILLGVNFGHLGFLTEIAPAELIATLDAVFAGKATYGERRMLLAQVYRRDKCIFECQAVNDAVVQKGARDRLLDLDFGVDQTAVMRVRADGLIVATPTGSTAYSLAAGGSIVYPSLSAFMVTPICAHSLTVRPLILPMSAQLSINIPDYEGKIFLTIDGQVSEAIFTGDSIRICQAKHIVRFVQSASRSYFEILRNKLNWGIANKTE